MLTSFLFLSTLLFSQYDSLRLKRIGVTPTGTAAFGCMVDSDRDGRLEYIFQFGFDPVIRNYMLQALECRPVNRYELVRSDTGVYLPLNHVVVGNVWPTAAGDIDRDGKTDIVGNAYYRNSTGTKTAICVIESRDSWSYPDTVVWWDSMPGSSVPRQLQYADMDRDGHIEIVQPWMETMVYENTGDNLQSLVYCAPPSTNSSYAIGDFDLNGRTDFAVFREELIQVLECVGDNQYIVVCTLNPDNRFNNRQLWTGNDVDQSGRPEFFATFVVPVGSYDTLCLYMFEATAEHEYTYRQVEAELVPISWVGTSLCADLDGDGVEEVIWSCGNRVIILKATGPGAFSRASTWWDDIGSRTLCNAGDLNGNGYNEVAVSGNIPGGNLAKRTVWLEVEAIRVLYPDTSSELRPGDTCEIRWRIHTPPRCDSVSLFLKTDTVVPNGERFWRLDTIVTGLAPNESSYAWVVPDTQLAWAKVLAIAYGPGWQFDESDSAFAVVPSGIAAGKPLPAPRDWALSVSPDPASAKAIVSYDVPVSSDISLSVLDA
ncbi:VCBS repeat-containing protein, partial [candidate division WOR-3 bacterium]|nr:VCBS repeat-containing protein [candidate division WOR-3 bacterium]